MTNSLLVLLACAPLLQAVSLGPAFAGATLADLLAVGACIGLLRDRSWLRAIDSWTIAALLLTAGWVAASGSWGASPVYALSKGLAVVGWGGVVMGLAGSGLALPRAVRFWVLGTALLLLGSLLVLVLWPEAGLYIGGASIGGLPRFRGVLGHPNLLGDYLSVSLILMVGLIGVSGRGKGALMLMATLTALALLGTVTTAWMGTGVVLAWAAWRASGDRWGTGRRTALIVLGVGLAVTTGAGVLRPLSIGLGDSSVVTSGLRPAIWQSASWAPRLSPIRGVGAAPYLAEAADPLGQSGALVLWDAHSTPLSILGQFGVVGAMLYLWLVAELLGVGGRIRSLASEGGAAQVASRLIPTRSTPLEAAVWLALWAASIHALVTSSEDFRHLWLLIGLAGLQARAARGVVRGRDSG